MSRDPIDVDDTGEARSENPIRKLYGEGRAEAVAAIVALPVPLELDELDKAIAGKTAILKIEPASEMQHVAGSVLRRGRAHANEYGAELVVIAIEREPRLRELDEAGVERFRERLAHLEQAEPTPSQRAALEALPTPGYAFGIASTSDDDETIALALRAIASRLERG